MVIKNYSVTLDTEIVEEAKEIIYLRGEKLSPIINEFLKNLIEREKRKRK